jgi:hypothetical protein
MENMMSDLSALIASLPQAVRDEARQMDDGIHLGQHKSRTSPPVILAPAPGPFVVIGDGHKRCSVRRIRVNDHVSVPMSSFALRMGRELSHGWVPSVVYRGGWGDAAKQIDPDKTWIRDLAEGQLRPSMPGGTCIDSVLFWGGEDKYSKGGSWRVGHTTATGRLEITATDVPQDGYSEELAQVDFTIKVQRPEGLAFTVTGRFSELENGEGCVEGLAVQLGDQPIKQRHILAASQILQALEPLVPYEPQDRSWSQALSSKLGLDPSTLPDD